jgi:hypothetical protein
MQVAYIISRWATAILKSDDSEARLDLNRRSLYLLADKLIHTSHCPKRFSTVDICLFSVDSLALTFDISLGDELACEE